MKLLNFYMLKILNRGRKSQDFDASLSPLPHPRGHPYPSACMHHASLPSCMHSPITHAIMHAQCMHTTSTSVHMSPHTYNNALHMTPSTYGNVLAQEH